MPRSKIIKKSVILFQLLNMTIWCKHVHRLELQTFFFNFCAAHLPVRLDIETKFPYFLFLTWLSIIRNQEFRLYRPNYARNNFSCPWCTKSFAIIMLPRDLINKSRPCSPSWLIEKCHLKTVVWVVVGYPCRKEVFVKLYFNESIMYI